MYKGHSIWDEEQEKYENISIDRDGNKQDYHNQEDYASGSNSSDMYNTEKGEKEDRKKEETGIEKEIAKEEKKYQKREEVSEEDIKRKAASEVREGGKEQDDNKKKKEHKSIEDAIKKAIKEQKELIYVND